MPHELAWSLRVRITTTVTTTAAASPIDPMMTAATACPTSPRRLDDRRAQMIVIQAKPGGEDTSAIVA